MREPRIGSLFTGTGALDQAARAVFGGRTVWVSDVKPAACTLLAERLPDAPNFGSITTAFPVVGPITAQAASLEPVDILTFGWPCQPHSAAGKRLGEADPRALWPNVLRVITILRPPVLLGENVARIASNGELRRVIRALAAIGYVGAWRCVTASAVGAPHKRDRCFLVALRPDVAERGRVFRRLTESADDVRNDGGARSFRQLDLPGAVKLLPTPTVRNVAGIDQRDNGRTHGLDLQTTIALLKTPTANLGSNGGTQHPDKRKAGGHGPTLADEVEWLLPTPSASSYGTNQGGAAGRVEPVRESLDTMARRDRLQEWGRYETAIHQWERISGRPAPSPTMPSPRLGGSPVLSPAFVEWMMGLPAGWVTDVPGIARSNHLSLLGDGVVPLQAERAYRACLADLAAIHA